MKNNNVNININKKDPIYTQAFKSISNLISKTKWSKILKVYFVSFFFLATALAAFYAFKVVSDKELLIMTTEKFSNNQEGEDIRDFMVTPKVQHELSILVYTLNAERGFIFELHNGKKNISGLPFRFADMTYEVVNEEKKVDKVAMQFQDIPLTLYKYPHYLQKQKMIIGTIEEIEKIDLDFAEHVKNCGGKYLGMIYLNSNGTPIGFLCVSYHKLENVPNKDVIKTKLSYYGSTITNLLDLQNYTQTENND